MSYITSVGNLAAIPELNFDQERGYAYCYARVLVSDRYRDEADQWVNGPTTAYDLRVTGNQAENLVQTAQDSGGHVRVMFSGTERVTPYVTREGVAGVNHEVRADEVAASMRGQSAVITKNPRR